MVLCVGVGIIPRGLENSNCTLLEVKGSYHGRQNLPPTYLQENGQTSHFVLFKTFLENFDNFMDSLLKCNKIEISQKPVHTRLSNLAELWLTSKIGGA